MKNRSKHRISEIWLKLERLQKVNTEKYVEVRSEIVYTGKSVQVKKKQFPQKNPKSIIQKSFLKCSMKEYIVNTEKMSVKLNLENSVCAKFGKFGVYLIWKIWCVLNFEIWCVQNLV